MVRSPLCNGEIHSDFETSIKAVGDSDFSVLVLDMAFKKEVKKHAPLSI